MKSKLSSEIITLVLLPELKFPLTILSSTYLACVSPLVQEHLGHNFAGKNTKLQIRFVTKQQKRNNFGEKSQLQNGFEGKDIRVSGKLKRKKYVTNIIGTEGKRKKQLYAQALGKWG